MNLEQTLAKMVGTLARFSSAELEFEAWLDPDLAARARFEYDQTQLSFGSLLRREHFWFALGPNREIWLAQDYNGAIQSKQLTFGDRPYSLVWQLLVPVPLLAALWLIPLGSEIVAGRPASRCGALPRRSIEPDDYPLLWPGASSYGIWVDDTTGVILRAVSYWHGQAFARYEVKRLDFGVEFPRTGLP